MRKFVLALTVLVLMLAAVVALAPMLIPASQYKSTIETAASEALGREVTIGDDLSFTIFPQTAFRVSDLTIANAEGFPGGPLVSMEEAEIGVRLAPVIQRKVEIKTFVLRKPTLNLARSPDGLVNWNLARADAPDAQPNETATPPVKELSLGDVRIVDGAATYTDQQTGKTYALDAINLAARLSSLDEPFTMEGDMNFQGAPASVDIIMTTPRAFLDKTESNLKLDLALGETTAGADLRLESGDAFAYSGPVSLNAPDLPALAALFDAPLEDAPGFDRLVMSGEAAGDGEKVKIAGSKIAFDAIDATGDLTLDLSGAKPKATGSLSTDALDLRPYMPPPAAAGAGFPAWSQAKLDFTSLRNVDANLSIAASKIFLNDLKIDQTRMKLTIENGRLVADIPEIAMYGGDGSGRLVVNARQATPSLSGVFNLGAVNAEPFTIDLMKMDRLLGLGSFNVEFIASGASQAAIMRSIDGKGGFDLADGAIKGVNIAKFARAIADLSSGVNPATIANALSTATGPDETTDYSKMLSNFTVENGLLSTRDISLAGPFLTMRGGGSVNLAQQTVDLRLSPRATTTADGEGGRAFSIPMRVTGTFSAPKVGIDAESLVRDRLQSGVRGLLDGALGGDQEGADANDDPAAALLRGVLGGAPRENGAEQDASAAETTAADAVNQFLFGGGRTNDTSEEDDPDTPNR